MTQGTVFVTGATGKIGRHLVNHLVSQGFYVKALARRKNITWPNSDKIQTIEADILDENVIRKAVQGCDYSFHLAAYLNINDKRKDLFQRVNVEGTKTVLNAALNSNIKKIVYVSTALVFDSAGKSEIKEGSAQKSDYQGDNYIETKIGALAYAREMMKRLPVVVVYPTAVIDLNDFASAAPLKSAGIQNLLWEKIGGGIPGGLVNLIGPKERIFNYVIVDDLVEGIILAAVKGQAGEEYILGGENITAADYLQVVFSRLNKRKFPLRIPIFPFKAVSFLGRFVSVPPMVRLIAENCHKDMRFSSEKAKLSLGYNPGLKLDSRIEQSQYL